MSKAPCSATGNAIPTAEVNDDVFFRSSLRWRTRCGLPILVDRGGKRGDKSSLPLGHSGGQCAGLFVDWRAVLIVGYLGAFTTFSTFSLDALLLAQEGFLLQALAYIVSSVVICLLFAWLGIALMRAL